MKRVVKVCRNIAGVVQEPLQEMYNIRLDNKQIPSCQTTQFLLILFLFTFIERERASDSAEDSCI